MSRFNDLFKWAVLLVAVFYLFVFWKYSENGRYVFYPARVEYASPVLIDSRTGEARMGVNNLKAMK